MSRIEARSAAQIGLTDRLRATVSNRARVRLGLALLEQGRDAEGFHYFALAARRGMAEAQFQVGRCYLSGFGVPRNPSQAAHWLGMSAQQDNREAQTLLAMLLFEGYDAEPGLFGSGAKPPDAETALRWAYRAAHAGEAEAQALVGHILSTGSDSVRDPTQADDWYRRSAEAGCPQGALGYGLARLRVATDASRRREAAGYIAAAAASGLPTAIHLLATLTADGHGVAQDTTAAAALFKKAAEIGVVAAQTRWGVALLEGLGTERDLTLAEFWLRRAALAHDPEAATRLGVLYTRGGEVPPNFTEAAHWLEQAAVRGRAEAARMLGQLYLSGAGVPRDGSRAREWLQKAMLAGDTQAGTDLGNLVLSGEAGTFDPSLLSDRFRSEAEAGDPFAAFNYGLCLLRGVGIAPDWRGSIVWLSKSREAVPEASYWIEEILSENGSDAPTASKPDDALSETGDAAYDRKLSEGGRSKYLH